MTENTKKDAERMARLLESEKMFSSFLKHSPIYVFFKDRDIRVLRLSENYEALLGLPAADAVGKTMADLFPSDLARSMVADDRRVLQEGRIVQVVEELNGRTFETTKFPILENGKPAILAGFTVDITEQRRFERALAESKDLFEQMYLQSSTSTQLLDPEGWCLRINPKLSEIFGVKAEDIEGRKYNILQDGEIIRTGVIDKLKRVFDHMETSTWEVEFDIGHASATTGVSVLNPTKKWISNKAYPIVDSDGTLRYVVIQHEDITELKNHEERSRQSHKMEAVGQLAGGIAHDFNNILSGIIGFTDLCLDEAPAGSTLQENLRQVMQAADRAKHLVRQILNFSRRNPTAKKRHLLKPLVNEAIGLLRVSMPSTMAIVTDIQPDTKPVHVNATEIHEVILNLAANAKDAMDERGVLTIRLSEIQLHRTVEGRMGVIPPGEYAVIEMADTGTGMDPATLERAFDPFFTTKGPGKGTGMGLSVVFGIIQSHGGNLQVSSTRGGGSVFRIFLPKVEGAVADPSAPEEISLRGTARILFVDDEPSLVAMATKMLTGLGYTVVGLTDGITALDHLTAPTSNFDLVVTDQTMPNLTGIELARKIRAQKPDLPIILCTGYSSGVTPEISAEAGIHTYLPKPLTRRELGTAVKNALKKLDAPPVVPS